MSRDNDNPNQGPGWGDTNTPFGPIHNYHDPSEPVSPGHNNDSGNNVGPSTQILIPGTRTYSGTYMSMCVTNLNKHEGFVKQMYVDSQGNITVGVGHLLSTVEMAFSLPFSYTHMQSSSGGSRNNVEMTASRDQIISNFNSLRANPKATQSVHLSTDAVINACIADVQIAEVGLRNLYSGYDQFSDNAKTGLVDMAFNLGITKLRNEFPSFNAAVNRRDWTTAATESHRVGISNQRNTDTSTNFLSAAAGR